MAKYLEDNKPINLTKKVEVNPFMPVDPAKKWEPSPEETTTTMTMPFGGQVPKFIDVQQLKENNGRS